MIADAELLRRYAEEKSEAAFAELVQRHLNLVHAAAWRQTRGSADLAQEVTQKVFTDLARKAGKVARHPALAGWLYRTTRYAAIDALRAQARQWRHETEEKMSASPEESEPSIDWEQLRPVLDEAMSELGERDREVVLLRYFEGRSYGEIGGGCGLTENAARMRVERALDKLRGQLARRGLTSTGAALAVVLADQAVWAAPTGMAASVTASALAGAASGGVLAGWTLFAMNKVTIALIAGIAAAGLTSAVFSWKGRWTRQENAVLRAENETLRKLKSTHEAAAGGAGVSLGEIADREKLATLTARVQEHNMAKKAETTAAAKEAKPGLQNRGNGAPMEAIETFTWACYTGDAAVLAKMIYFDGNGRKLAEAKLAEMPAFLRDQYKTPEDLYGFFIAADALVAPPPSDPELLQKIDAVFVKSDRIEMRAKGSSKGRMQYQWTAEGWKYAFPEEGVEGLAANVLRNNPLPAPEGP